MSRSSYSYKSQWILILTWISIQLLHHSHFIRTHTVNCDKRNGTSTNFCEQFAARTLSHQPRLDKSESDASDIKFKPTKGSLIPNSFFGLEKTKDSEKPENATPSEGRVQKNDASIKSASERPRRSPPRYYPMREALYLPERDNPVLEYSNEYIRGVSGPEASINFFRYRHPPRIHRPLRGRRHPGSRKRRPLPRRQTLNRFPSRRRRPVSRPYPSIRDVPAQRQSHARRKPTYTYPRDASNIQDILTYFQRNENDPPPLPPTQPFRPQHSQPMQQQTYASPDLGPVSMGGDFSKELHDVQSSLLKDIREFAQRPNWMSYPQPLLHTTTAPPPLQTSSYNYARKIPEQPEIDEDEILKPKAKPVRDLVQDHPIPLPKRKYKSKEKEWGQETSNEEEIQPYKKRHRDRYRESSEKSVSKGSEENSKYSRRERYRYKSGRLENTGRYKKKEKVEKDRELDRLELESLEDERDLRRDILRRKPRIKSRRRKRPKDGVRLRVRDSEENPSIEDVTLADEAYQNHRYEDTKDVDRLSSYSHHVPSSYYHYNHRTRYATTAAPIVLKKPYGRYRSVTKALEALDQDRKSHLWNSWERGTEVERLPLTRSIPTTYHTTRYAPMQTGLPPPPSVPKLENIVEIHTGGPAYNHIQRPINPLAHHEKAEADRKNRLHKLYLEYLERKLEAETLAAVAAKTTPLRYDPPPPPVKMPPPASPMRMKIHIYPNENPDVTGSLGSERVQTYQPPTVPPPRTQYSLPPPHRYSAQQKSPLSYTHNHNQRMDSYLTGQSSSTQTSFVQPPRHPTKNGRLGESKGGPSTAIDKNKNLVLHLHVHRRNDEVDAMTAASEIHTTTIKPLTYKEIFDQVQAQQQQQETHHHRRSYSSDTVDPANESLSMELPLPTERIEDVLQSLLKFRGKK